MSKSRTALASRLRHAVQLPAVKRVAEKAAQADRRSVASLVEKLLVEHLVKEGYLKAGAAE